jgi:hypothetical protein
VLEDHRGIFLVNVLDIVDARDQPGHRMLNFSSYWLVEKVDMSQQLHQRRLARLQRLPPQVHPVELQQVEGIQERLGLLSRAIAQPVEHRETVLVHDHDLSIDDAALARERHQRGRDRRIALRPHEAVAGDQVHAAVILPRLQAVAVMLDLVNPSGAGRRLLGQRREARFDKRCLRRIKAAAELMQHGHGL